MRVYRDVVSIYKDSLLTAGYILDIYQERNGRYFVAAKSPKGTDVRYWSSASLANALGLLCISLQVTPTFHCYACQKKNITVDDNTPIRYLPNGDAYPVCPSCGLISIGANYDDR